MSPPPSANKGRHETLPSLKAVLYIYRWYLYLAGLMLLHKFRYFPVEPARFLPEKHMTGFLKEDRFRARNIFSNPGASVPVYRAGD